MEIIKTTTGKIALVLSNEELIDLLNKSKKAQYTEQVEKVPEENPLKGLTKSTRDFYEEIKKTFGRAIIDRKDNQLIKLCKKHMITNPKMIFYQFEKRGLAIVALNDEGKQDSIQLK